MSRSTSNRLFRPASILAMSAALAPVMAPMVASATGMIAGGTYQANHCDQTFGSAPTGEWFQIDAYNNASTPSGEQACVWDDEADAFVRWVAPANGRISAAICPGGDVTPDWVLELRDGCNGSLLMCGFETDSEELPEACYRGARVEFEVEAGQAYILRVAGAFQTTGADYGQSMIIEFEESPALTGDLNLDGRVNGLDLGLLFANWTG